jgi:hypothetical protein
MAFDRAQFVRSTSPIAPSSGRLSAARWSFDEILEQAEKEVVTM